MKTSKFVLLIFITLLIGSSLLIGGCSTAAKKPAQPMPSTPSTPSTPITPTPAPKPMPNTTPAAIYPKEVANRAAMEAGKVMDVNKATAIVSGKIIYIGLDLKANLDKQKSAAVEKTVMDRVKKVEPGYTVMVTSDADTVTRIKNVATGISQGKPLSSFANEISIIGTRITPKTK